MPGQRPRALAYHRDVAYNKDQWIASFEGRLAILRPHLTERILGTMSLPAWHEFGARGVDPIDVAEHLSALLDRRPAASP